LSESLVCTENNDFTYLNKVILMNRVTPNKLKRNNKQVDQYEVGFS